MKLAGIEPVEFTSKAYVINGQLTLDADGQVTIVEHTPARPDWADALVVRDQDGDLWGRAHGGYRAIADDSTGVVFSEREIDRAGGLTVVLDGDGNPPEPERQWLDADALDKLPDSSIIVSKVGLPRVRLNGEWFLIPGGIGVRSEHLDPARVLWAPKP